ncbi:MAG: hypothetical protein ACR2OJ_00225 [Hyphomicrobiales bacterium]
MIIHARSALCIMAFLGFTMHAHGLEGSHLSYFHKAKPGEQIKAWYQMEGGTDLFVLATYDDAGAFVGVCRENAPVNMQVFSAPSQHTDELAAATWTLLRRKGHAHMLAQFWTTVEGQQTLNAVKSGELPGWCAELE